MDLNETALEKELKNMAPANPGGSLLDRLADAMDQAAAEVGADQDQGHRKTHDPGLSMLEKTLKNLVPHGMPDNMIGRLDEAMSRWHEKVPLEEKVVSIESFAPARRQPVRPGWRAMATVALLGAGAAFLSKTPDPGQPSTAQRIPVLTDGRAAPVVFTPGKARASVVSTNDHGVVWVREGLPVRCFEVESKSEVSFQNERGEKLIIAQPRREIMFTPVKFD